MEHLALIVGIVVILVALNVNGLHPAVQSGLLVSGFALAFYNPWALSNVNAALEDATGSAEYAYITHAAVFATVAGLLAVNSYPSVVGQA